MENVTKKYLKAQDKAGFKPGDKVRVMFKAETFAQGWSNAWIDGMTEYVGKVGLVMEYPRIDEGGIPVSFSYVENSEIMNIDHCFCFPYFVLEKVNELS